MYNKLTKNRIKALIKAGQISNEILLKYIVSVFDEMEIQWWLDFGQLLSLHRSNNALPLDDDWDFCVVPTKKHNYNSILKLINAFCNNIYTKQDNLIRFNVNNINVDIYFCNFDMENKIMRQKNFKNGGFDMPAFFYDKLDVINFGELRFKVPRHLDDYLLIRYGDDWRTPIKKNMSNVYVNVGQKFKKDKYTCLIAGVFDGLHEGHKNLIDWGLKYFDEVKVGVHSDEDISYKASPTNGYIDRVNLINQTYPMINIVERCPLVTDKAYLETIGCDYVMFGKEDSPHMKIFYPNEAINHPIDRYPIISSRLINKVDIKSFCINLEDKENKYFNVLREMSKINVYPERFVVNKHKIEQRIKREGVNEKLNQILESHLMLYKKLSQTDGDIFLVLEDDAIVIDDIDLTELMIKAPKDWDVIYLGGVNHHKDHPPVIIDDIFYKAKFTFNAHAFLIKKSFIPNIIHYLEKKEYQNDVIFGYMQSKGIGNWYGIIKDAIIQNGIESPTFITTYPINKRVLKMKNAKVIKPYNKIFQIGFNKCGTTSIHQMFINCGINSIHWHNGQIAKRIQHNIDKNIMPLTGIDKYDCYTDVEDLSTNSFPMINHYKLLDEKYPNSIFILNTRPIDKWVKSRLNHQSGGYANQYKSVLNVTSDDELIANWVSTWNRHHEEVLRYFENNNRFIMFDIESEGGKLVEFLRSWSIPVKSFLNLHK